jgi:osmotically-inducible protein OsmY
MNRRHFFLWVAGPAALALAQSAVSDDTIHDKVMMRLANDADVRGGGLTIDVAKGVVTVRGVLATEKAKAKAEKVIKKVKGVTGVKNMIEVRPAGIRP